MTVAGRTPSKYIQLKGQQGDVTALYFFPRSSRGVEIRFDVTRRPCVAALIDTTSLSVTVPELPAPSQDRRCYLDVLAPGRYPPSRLLLMAFKVVTCEKS